VVVVVPTLAEDENAEREIVPRRIVRCEPPPAPKMSGRVDEQWSVERERSRDPEAPHDAGPAENSRAHDPGHQRREPLEAIEETQLRKANELANVRNVGMVVLATENPAQVRMPEPSERRRVRIARTVGEAMVAAVTARPPQRTILHRSASEPRQNEMKDAAGLECVMRKIAVVARRHTEGLQQVTRASEADDAPGAGHEWGEQARTMYAKNDPSRRKVDQPRLEWSSNGCCRFDQLALGASRRIARNRRWSMAKVTLAE